MRILTSGAAPAQPIVDIYLRSGSWDDGLLAPGCVDFDARKLPPVRAANDFDGSAADKAVLNIVLFIDGQVDDQRDAFSAVRAAHLNFFEQAAQKLSLR